MLVDFWYLTVKLRCPIFCCVPIVPTWKDDQVLLLYMQRMFLVDRDATTKRLHVQQQTIDSKRRQQPKFCCSLSQPTLKVAYFIFNVGAFGSEQHPGVEGCARLLVASVSPPFHGSPKHSQAQVVFTEVGISHLPTNTTTACLLLHHHSSASHAAASAVATGPVWSTLGWWPSFGPHRRWSCSDSCTIRNPPCSSILPF
jgi:hypothetical protein